MIKRKTSKHVEKSTKHVQITKHQTTIIPRQKLCNLSIGNASLGWRGVKWVTWCKMGHPLFSEENIDDFDTKEKGLVCLVFYETSFFQKL